MCFTASRQWKPEASPESQQHRQYASGSQSTPQSKSKPPSAPMFDSDRQSPRVSPIPGLPSPPKKNSCIMPHALTRRSAMLGSSSSAEASRHPPSISLPSSSSSFGSTPASMLLVPSPGACPICDGIAADKALQAAAKMLAEEASASSSFALTLGVARSGAMNTLTKPTIRTPVMVSATRQKPAAIIVRKSSGCCSAIPINEE
mmetsp:Transcript_18087/g.41931  ORF Transcript_18087/g.41931 Transcript_18087/m.41931 type:complete len:203 (-) Transcript_18087:474-1082(-)